MVMLFLLMSMPVTAIAEVDVNHLLFLLMVMMMPVLLLVPDKFDLRGLIGFRRSRTI